jgi:hypothetical protein
MGGKNGLRAELAEEAAGILGGEGAGVGILKGKVGGVGGRGSGEGGLAGLPGAGDDDGVGGEAFLKEWSEKTWNGMLRQRRRHRD